MTRRGAGRMIRMIPTAAFRDQHCAIVHEYTASAPRVADPPQCQSRQVGWTADSSPRVIVSLCYVAGTEFPAEIDEQFPVRGKVALVRINPPPKPLSRRK
jgi:hypothetical protein